MVREIAILRIPISEDDVRSLQEDWVQVLTSHQLTMGVFTRRFEDAFGEFTGAKFAVAVSNGTSALEIIIRALRLEGKSIIVPTNTFLASALAVMHAGNKVVFADSNPRTMGLDPQDVARKINKDTAAVMAVHIGGMISPEIEALGEICSRHNLFLIEDCAHAHGSSYKGRHAGLLGVAGGFSFFPTKTLTTGEGGMIITQDETLYRKLLLLRNQGKNPEFNGRISEFGHNWRISELTAVLGVQQVKRAPEILEERRRIARFYDEALREFQGIESISLPPQSTSSYYKYMTQLKPNFQRDAVKKIMREKHGVSLPGEVYADLCDTEPLWDQYTYCGKRRNGPGGPTCPRWPGCGCKERQAGFPGAEHLSKHHLCLPMYPGLNRADLEYIMESLQATLHKLS